jgi:hypothetical protein
MPRDTALWPAIMSAKVAAAYTSERSPRAFRRRVGTVYPPAIHIPGRGDVWRKEDLDQRIAGLGGNSAATILDAADVL